MNLTLFDLDGTLIPGDSDHAFGLFLQRLGWADAQEWRAGNDRFYADYQRGHLDMAAYIAFATAPWRQRSAGELAAAQQQFMREVISPMLRDNARALVRRHQAAGDLVAIVTATNEFVTAPIAAAFGVDHLLAVRLARDTAGRCTGAIEGTPTYQGGKVVRIHEWLGTLGHRWEDFSQVHAYSDSPNDLPMLEAASHPVATNPTPALAAIAQQRGWPVLTLFPEQQA